MRITGFKAENFKRLKAVEIDPDTNTVVIGGRNAQGKTSILDGIMAALGGKAGAKHLTRPIRDGETKARVVVELDDLVVERKWTPSGSTVTVGPKDGTAKLNSPQAVLDKLIGSLSFDPLAFAQAAPKDQVETLIDIIGRSEFDRITAERKAYYEERTTANREVKRLQGAVGSLPNPVVEQVERVDISQVSIELEAAIELERARVRWQQIQEQIEALEEEQGRVALAAQAVIDKVKPRPSAEIREQIARADEINKAADTRERRDSLLEDLQAAEDESERLTGLILAADAEKRDLIASAALPIDGLSFDEDGVAYNGVPFDQSSAAERLRVSVAMAMAMNPELRVICIRDASLLDADSRAALVALATEKDYQIWYEVVGDVGQIGVTIEDGQVKA
jgi:hypothetical protein